LDRHVLAQRSLQAKPCRPSGRMSCQNAMVKRTLNMHFESILSWWNVLSYSCLSFFSLTTAVSKIVFFWIKKKENGKNDPCIFVLHTCSLYSEHYCLWLTGGDITRKKKLLKKQVTFPRNYYCLTIKNHGITYWFWLFKGQC